MTCWADMNWAAPAIAKLQAGDPAVVKPHGNSMLPRVKSGQPVTINPIDATGIYVGDVVLVKVKGNVYLHLVKAFRVNKGRAEFQIGNNKGGINGWVGRNAIYGIAELKPVRQ